MNKMLSLGMLTAAVLLVGNVQGNARHHGKKDGLVCTEMVKRRVAPQVTCDKVCDDGVMNPETGMCEIEVVKERCKPHNVEFTTHLECEEGETFNEQTQMCEKTVIKERKPCKKRESFKVCPANTKEVDGRCVYHTTHIKCHRPRTVKAEFCPAGTTQE